MSAAQLHTIVLAGPGMTLAFAWLVGRIVLALVDSSDITTRPIRGLNVPGALSSVGIPATPDGGYGGGVLLTGASSPACPDSWSSRLVAPWVRGSLVTA